MNQTMTWKEAITIDPEIMVGKPVIAGTRLTVEFIVGLLAGGWTEEQIIEHHEITRDQILGCLAYAHDVLAAEHAYPTDTASR